MAEIIDSLGNMSLLDLPKTAFLCSRNIPASVVLRCYDWAISQREQGNCIMSGFHSPLEQDVLRYLLKGTQPIIVVLARGMKTQIESEWLVPIETGRLLVITPFDGAVSRVTRQTAHLRNQVMVSLADQIMLGHISAGGQLASLLAGINKPIHFIADTA
jgi:hypothetical protein